MHTSNTVPDFGTIWLLYLILLNVRFLSSMRQFIISSIKICNKYFEAMLKLTKIYHTVKNKYLLVISSLDNCEGSPYLYYISKYNYLSSVRNLPINIYHLLMSWRCCWLIEYHYGLLYIQARSSLSFIVLLLYRWNLLRHRV